jgi:hypothetical protein
MIKISWNKLIGNLTQRSRAQPSSQAVHHAQWSSHVRESRRLPMDIPESRLVRLIANHPKRVAAIKDAAENVLQHRFTLLGAKDFSPVDPDRRVHTSGYRPIDWRLDPVSGLRFPAGFKHTEWNIQTMRPGNADIKLPWELARCQHWPLLGQAWRLTGDQRFAEELGRQFMDFVEANPIGLGVNWVCTMDVALRAANWALGLQLIRQWGGLDQNFWPFAYQQLIDHGNFIRNNLEDKYEVTSNHFLSNVVGLLYVAAVCRDRPEGQSWLDWCIPMLEREIDIQVLDDGADFESSVPYHRLVTELFLGAWTICNFLGRPLSPHVTRKLVAMVDYLMGVMRPDGLMPQSGDADDGRLHILSDYGAWQPQDPRHLLGPASVAFDRPDWADFAGEVAAWEAAWWGYDASTVMFASNLPPTIKKLYPSAGVAVSRQGGNYLLITNAVVGTVGFGNHKHNDQLAFELHCDGEPLLVDPGSHVYTGNPDSRNQFRGTAFHNTLMIDGVEQNEINLEWLFRMFEKAHPAHLDFSWDANIVRYRGLHRAYERLTTPVTHERRFEHDTLSGALHITDNLAGNSTHRLHWHFHCAPGLKVKHSTGLGAFDLTRGNRRYVIRSNDGLSGRINPSRYSPSYGVEIPCQAIDFEIDANLAEANQWSFSVFPANS